MEGQPLLAQVGVEGGEALEPALVLAPVLVAGTATSRNRPQLSAPWRSRARRVRCITSAKAAALGGVDLVLHRHHHRAGVVVHRLGGLRRTVGGGRG
jgi:hypothetical protein